MKSAIALFFLPLAFMVITTNGLQFGEASPGKRKKNKKKSQGFTQKQKTQNFFHKEPPPPPPPAIIKVDSQTNYASFTHQLSVELRKRPLGRGSLEHFLMKIADPMLANTGEWVEFGCATGKTIGRIFKRRKELGSKRVVHGFDSFKGLPSTWRPATVGGVQFQEKWLKQGSFDRSGQPPFEDPTNVQWHVGWFNETVQAFAKNPESVAVGPITFAHMDADIYSSTAQVFENIEHRLAPGAYLVFDDLLGYPEYQDHEMKALYEMLKRTGRSLKVIGYPGPLLIELPSNLKIGLMLQKGEHKNIPQNALVQLI